MQQLSKSSYGNVSNMQDGRGSKTLAGTLFFFMMIGFMAGIVLLVIRNWYLFS